MIFYLLDKFFEPPQISIKGIALSMKFLGGK